MRKVVYPATDEIIVFSLFSLQILSKIRQRKFKEIIPIFINSIASVNVIVHGE